ncbi:MAG: Uma2 family endonuclease [Aggregatilineales bacterium]
MQEKTITQADNRTGLQRIVATDVSADDYMAVYADKHYEWVGGIVYAMSPIHDRHYQIEKYLSNLIDIYFEMNPIGVIKEDPFVMRFKFEEADGTKKEARRQPDIQVILEKNPGTLTDTYMDGAADIVIEIISPATEGTDRGIKFSEYRRGGVREYWIIDPVNQEILFYILNNESVYVPQYVDNDENYHISQLPGLVLHVPTLWQKPLPGVLQTVEYVRGLFV